jgi:hypothetical protein
LHVALLERVSEQTDRAQNGRKKKIRILTSILI